MVSILTGIFVSLILSFAVRALWNLFLVPIGAEPATLFQSWVLIIAFMIYGGVNRDELSD